MRAKVKTSTVLRCARGHIEAKSKNYICLAIEACDWDDPATNRALRLVRRRMQMPRFAKWVAKHTRIASHFEDPYYRCETSLEWWLVWKGYVSAAQLPTKAQMREYRLAWLDELIQELEARGD